MARKENKTEKKKGAFAAKISLKALNLVELKLVYAVSIAFVLLGDAITKAMAVALDESGSGYFPLIEGFIDFHYAENLGMAAGKFSDSRFLFIVPSVIVMALILLYLIFDNGWNPAIGVALSLTFGGGVGNLIERVSADGAVVDFIYVVPFNFFPFTCIFNVADVFVCLGAGILVYELLKSIIADSKKEATGVTEDTAVAPPAWVRFIMEDKKAAEKNEAEDEVQQAEDEDNE